MTKRIGVCVVMLWVFSVVISAQWRVDRTLPTVTITAPVNGATVSNAVVLAATATDNVGVVGVQFQVDGSNVGSEDTRSPYTVTWTSTSKPNGVHTISARARDAAGNRRTASISVTVANTVTPPPPPPTQVTGFTSGAWADASGNPHQSHLVYAVNSGVWWACTLTSVSNTRGNHLVKCYVSSTADLATATWTAASSVTFGGDTAPNQTLGSGRSLGMLYWQNGTTDVIHLRLSISYDGQEGVNAHVRGVVSPSSITWGGWSAFASPGASEWQGVPHGDALGVSTSGFIHAFSSTQDFEIDANALRSITADTGTNWTTGWNFNPNWTGGARNRPPAFVFDNTMVHEAKHLAFQPLNSDVMLAVYGNGGAVEPNCTNLRYTRSGANGTWADQGSGTGNVFSTSVTQHDNDWTSVGVDTTHVYVARRGNATQINVNGYSVSGNTFVALSAQPPSVTGTIKAGAGVMGVTDGVDFWLAVIVDNTIQLCKYTVNAGAWSAWTLVTTVDASATFLSGYPKVAVGQIGLLYSITNGGNTYVVVGVAKTS
jgi:hypothetical protein